MPKLTISIVNYNTGNFLIECLESLRKVKSEADFEVHIVDNASRDGSIEKAKEKYPEFKFLINKKNLGFGRAHNQVLKKAKNPYLLVLNPDSIVLPGTLSYMLRFMDKNPSVGASTCRIEKTDGTLDIASHRGFPTPLASFLYFFLKNDRLYHLTNRDMSRVHEIDAIVGAFMLIRKTVLEKVGYFDEDYFLYAEDLDLCFRIKEAGYKIMYIPNVSVIHIKGISSGIKKHSRASSLAKKSARLKSINYFYSTMKIFYKKHYEKKYPIILNWLVYLGIDLKLILAKRKLSV